MKRNLLFFSIFWYFTCETFDTMIKMSTFHLHWIKMTNSLLWMCAFWKESVWNHWLWLCCNFRIWNLKSGFQSQPILCLCFMKNRCYIIVSSLYHIFFIYSRFFIPCVHVSSLAVHRTHRNTTDWSFVYIL